MGIEDAKRRMRCKSVLSVGNRMCKGPEAAGNMVRRRK